MRKLCQRKCMQPGPRLHEPLSPMLNDLRRGKQVPTTCRPSGAPLWRAQPTDSSNSWCRLWAWDPGWSDEQKPRRNFWDLDLPWGASVILQKRITHEDLLLQTGDNEMTMTLNKCDISALSQLGEGYIFWFGNRLPWIQWLTPEDILSKDLTSLSGSKSFFNMSGDTLRIRCGLFHKLPFSESTDIFFFLVEYKNNYTKTQMPIPIQGVYKLLCMFTWRWPSLSHAFPMLLKKQNVLIRLCIIYWCSDGSSLKFIEDFGWPTS